MKSFPFGGKRLFREQGPIAGHVDVDKVVGRHSFVDAANEERGPYDQSDNR
jgi:hypothetical protein